MKKLISAALAIALCTLAWDSQAQTKFGDKGTLAIHVATGSPMLATQNDPVQFGATPTLGFSTITYSDPDECIGGACTSKRTRVTSIYLDPRIHYFVIENLSIGGEILLASFSGTTITETKAGGRTDRREYDLDSAPTAFGLMPIIGYNVRLGEKFSIWPQGGIGFRRTTYKDLNRTPDVRDDVDTYHAWWFVNVDVPFLLHIVPNFAIGAGPGATFSLSETVGAKGVGFDRSTSGFSTTMFRWFNAHVIGYF